MINFIDKYKKPIFKVLLFYYYPPSISYIIIEGIKLYINKK